MRSLPNTPRRLTACLTKGNESYLFSYFDTPASRSQALQTVCQFAADPELDLSWSDAAMLCRDIRKVREPTK